MKAIKYLVFFVTSLGIGFAVGPRPQFQALDATPLATLPDLATLEQTLAAHEAATPKLKPHNQARIVWADSVRQTEYAIVYLPGFSATEREGGPIHERIARRYGCNLLLARMPDHGIADTNSFRGIEPQQWVQAAKESVAMGKAMGRRVIVMATSTGATLALHLAAADPAIHSLILYSPNIDIFDGRSHIINLPWGRQMRRTITGGDYHSWEANDSTQMFWSTRYHADGLHALRHLVSTTMVPATFSAVRQPTFITYYYKNEQEQDDVVSVAAIEAMIPQLGTPPAQLRTVVNTTAGTHGIPCSLWNPHWHDAERDTRAFCEEVLGLKVVADF